MLQRTTIKKLLIASTLFIGVTSVNAQKIQRPQPKFWLGVSGAANLDFYTGTTQTLNPQVKAPTAFHDGFGFGGYVSVLGEYRFTPVWGAMLNIGYDGRGGSFKAVNAPCDCPEGLKAHVGYVTFEPALRIAPFKSPLYIFAGPAFSLNVTNSFTYSQKLKDDSKGEFSDIRTNLFSGQIGAGYEIPLSSSKSLTQVNFSPFISYHPYFGQNPRSVESWSISTLRIGMALKFGKAHAKAGADNAMVPAEGGVLFSVRAPLVIPVRRQVRETFPLRNSVFFNMGSSDIPVRYVMLSKEQAASFKEIQLQQDQPSNLLVGRSARQMAVYHNILNIIGDRLRSFPLTTITLTGASDKDPAQGKVMAENIKTYLVNVFGIAPSRITTEGRDKPLVPSEQPGATKELALLKEGDRRVDIESNSPELLLEVGGKRTRYLRPVQITAVQEDPMDSHVVFNAAGASESLKSWSVDVIDIAGGVQHFGPYTNDQASVSGNTILRNSSQGTYKVIMTGETKTGAIIKQERSVSLLRKDDPKQEGLRYSILFDFDKSETVAGYEKFLTDVVAPLIPSNSTVTIHGHTDIIGDEKYNVGLSQDRAVSSKKIIEQALSLAGKKDVKFDIFGFGEDINASPFDNNLPEERFYNRTVIIDIVSNK